MRSLVRFGVFAAPLVVVATLGELHAHLIGHYSFTVDNTHRLVWTALYVVLLEISVYAAGIPDAPSSWGSAAWTSLGAVLGAAVVISLVQLASGSSLMPRVVIFGSALVLIPILTLLCMAEGKARIAAAGADRVVAVLGPDEAASLESDLAMAPERQAQLVAVLAPSDSPLSGPLQAEAAPGGLVRLAREKQANLVVLGRQAASDEWLVAQAALLHGAGIRIRSLSAFYDEWLGKLPITDLERVSLMFDIQEIHAPQYARVKRLVDIAAGLVGLALMVVAVPVVAVADLLGNRGPLLFTQERVGKSGRTFVIYKFRTMAGEPTGEWTSIDDPRVRLVGRVLRRTHVDELPQSLNLLRGTISLVGPRPEQPRYVEELREKIPFYDVRHLVNPGVTGWAQVKFLYGSSVHDALQKLQYEFFYMRHQGPVLDMRIAARTLRSVFRLNGR